MSCRISGLLVTIPLPRGKKSLPTMFSSTEDLPEDWEPTTTWRGSQCHIKLCEGGEPYNLRQIQTIIADSIENQILKFIDYSKQVFTKGSHGVVLGVDEDPLARKVQSRRGVVASTSFEMKFPRCAPKE